MTDDYTRANNTHESFEEEIYVEREERLESLMLAAGGVGRFQYMSFFVMLCFIESISIVFYILPLYLK